MKTSSIPQGYDPVHAEGQVPQVILHELKRRISLILLVVALMLGQTGVSLVSPLLLKTLFDRAIPARDGTLIAWLLVGMVVAPLLALVLSGLQEHLSITLGLAVAQALRLNLMGHLLRARITDIEQVKTGEIVYRLTRECGRIGELYVAQELLPVVSSTALFLGTLIVMLIIDWRLSLFLLLALPLSYLLTKRLSRPVETVDKEFIDTMEDGQSYLQEVFAGLRTVRAFNGQGYEGQRWRDWNKRHWRATSKSQLFHIPAFLYLGSNLINNLFVGFVFGYGALRIIRGEMTVGALVSFVAFVPRIYSAFDSFLRAQVGMQGIRASVEKLEELYRLPLEAVPERAVPLPLPKGGARVAFQGISFHYSRGFGVEDLTFEVQPNEFWGIVGPSGGGKTTVIDLLLGFHAPDSGAIAIDGVDIRELSFEALREQVGLVSQDVFLWNASIWDNLVYPEKHFAREAVEQAAKMAEIGDFISALPEGYGTIVGERGLALSAGERQRLALARAILRQPRLILLDEATSALDALTELRIRQALDVARAGRTAIVVAHRLATVMPADMILVIDKGRIAERGTPKELLARRGLFYELCEAQSVST